MEKKKKIIVGCCIGFVVIVAAIGTGFWYNAYQAEQNQISLLPADSEIYTMELGSATPSDASVFIDKENTSEKMQNADKEIQLVYTDDQIITKEDGISYLKVGDYEGTISVGSKNLPFTMHIVDTTAPEATLSQESISFDYGTDLSSYDWTQHISVTDLDEVNISVDQAVDTSTAGNYTVKYIIADSSGNSVEKELAVTVNEKPVQTTTTTGSTGSGGTSTKKNNSSGSSSSYSGSSSSGSSSGGSNSSGNTSSNSSGGLTPGQSWNIDTDYIGTTNGSDIYGSDWIPIP